MTAIAHRIACRHRIRTAAVLFRDVPGPGYCWGFFVQGPARMHLVQLDAAHVGMVIYLEGPGGQRCYEPDPGLPRDVAEHLREHVRRARLSIEAAWARHMILKGWIHAHIESGHLVCIAYPGASQEFVRVVHMGARAQEDDVSLDAAGGDIIIGHYRARAEQIRVPLAGLLWR